MNFGAGVGATSPVGIVEAAALVVVAGVECSHVACRSVGIGAGDGATGDM